MINDESNNNLYSFQAWSGRNLAFGGRYNVILRHLKSDPWPTSYFILPQGLLEQLTRKSAKYLSGEKLIWGIWCEYVMYRKWTVFKFVTKRTLVNQMMFFFQSPSVSREAFSVFLTLFPATSGLTISEIDQKSSRS